MGQKSCELGPGPRLAFNIEIRGAGGGAAATQPHNGGSPSQHLALFFSPNIVPLQTEKRRLSDRTRHHCLLGYGMAQPWLALGEQARVFCDSARPGPSGREVKSRYPPLGVGPPSVSLVRPSAPVCLGQISVMMRRKKVSQHHFEFR